MIFYRGSFFFSTSFNANAFCNNKKVVMTVVVVEEMEMEMEAVVVGGNAICTEISLMTRTN